MMNIDSYLLATKDIEQKLANIDSDNRKKLFLELINDFTIYSNLVRRLVMVIKHFKDFF